MGVGLRQKGYAPSSMKKKIVGLNVFCSYWFEMGSAGFSLLQGKISFLYSIQLPAPNRLETKDICLLGAKIY